MVVVADGSPRFYLPSLMPIKDNIEYEYKQVLEVVSVPTVTAEYSICEPEPTDFGIVTVVFLESCEPIKDQIETSKQGKVNERHAKKLSMFQRVAEDYPEIFRDHILAFLKNQVQPNDLKKGYPFFPSQHITRVAMLNRDFYQMITTMFHPLTFEDYIQFMSITNAIEMFYEVPECISTQKMGKFSMFHQNYKQLKRFSLAWESEMFGGPVF